MAIIRAALGQPFEVTVMESPSTGYVWEPSQDSSTALQACPEPPPASQPQGKLDQLRLGGQRPRTLRFQGVQTGEHRLILILRRPWTTEVTPVDTVEHLVQID